MNTKKQLTTFLGIEPEVEFYLEGFPGLHYKIDSFNHLLQLTSSGWRLVDEVDLNLLVVENLIIVKNHLYKSDIEVLRTMLRAWMLFLEDRYIRLNSVNLEGDIRSAYQSTYIAKVKSQTADHTCSYVVKIFFQKPKNLQSDEFLIVKFEIGSIDFMLKKLIPDYAYSLEELDVTCKDFETWIDLRGDN